MKIKKLKYPKNPQLFLERVGVMDYLLYLEENGTLDKLAPSFLAYYVIAEVLLNEVNNGGFEQYLSNSTVATLPFLETSSKLIENKELNGVIGDLITELKHQFGSLDILAIKNADYNDDFSNFLSDLDDRFYELDEKCDIEKIARTYYQNNIPTGECEIQIIKPRETDTFRYVVNNVNDITIQDATDSFIDFLNEFEGIKWKIEIVKFEKYFRLNAIDDTNSIDLDKVFKNFSKSKSALKLLKFEEININNDREHRHTYTINIKPSGFEKHEFSMKHFGSSSSIIKHEISAIILGYMNLTYDKYNVNELAQIIVKRAETQNNLSVVYEKDWTDIPAKYNVIFEK